MGQSLLSHEEKDKVKGILFVPWVHWMCLHLRCTGCVPDASPRETTTNKCVCMCVFQGLFVFIYMFVDVCACVYVRVCVCVCVLRYVYGYFSVLLPICYYLFVYRQRDLYTRGPRLLSWHSIIYCRLLNSPVVLVSASSWLNLLQILQLCC